MAYNKKSRNSYNRKREYNPDEVTTTEVKRAGRPSLPEATGNEVTKGYIRKMVRDLQFGTSITVKADPSSQAASGSNPYQLITENNKIIDRRYTGQANLSGNLLPVMLNDGATRLMDRFDSVKMNLNINYRFIGEQVVNDQYKKAYDEAISKGYAESFTALPFFDYNVTSATYLVGKHRLSILLGYQIYLQQLASIVNKYNLLMAMETHLKDMSYNREEPVLNELYGLFKKASFRSLINTIGANIKTEYFDLDWMKYVNQLVMVPSRRTSGYKTPILYLDGDYQEFQLMVEVVEGVQAIDSSNWMFGVNGILDKIDPHNVLKWARQFNNGSTSLTAKQYFNGVTDDLEAAIPKITKFKNDTVEVRTVLDTMTRVGLCNWVRGVSLTASTINDYQPAFNKVVNDIYLSQFTGSYELKFNENTQRFSIFTTWDRYLGIPTYEMVSGGAFLTFSTKYIPSAIPASSHKRMVPRLFYHPTTPRAHTYNRKGVEAVIESKQLTNTALNNSAVFNRLNPLGITLPNINYPLLGTNSHTLSEKSALIDLGLEVFRCGMVHRSDTTYHEFVHPDSVMFVDVELEDVTNEMHTYAISNGPLRTIKPVISGGGNV